jgi:hypothetical protein
VPSFFSFGKQISKSRSNNERKFQEGKHIEFLEESYDGIYDELNETSPLDIKADNVYEIDTKAEIAKIGRSESSLNTISQHFSSLNVNEEIKTSTDLVPIFGDSVLIVKLR